jgi:hypothetical protein
MVAHNGRARKRRAGAGRCLLGSPFHARGLGAASLPEDRDMSDEAARYLRIVALTIAAALGAWTARACYRARKHGAPGGDAAIWAALAAVYLLLAQTKLARVLGWLKGLGLWLRAIAREHHLYAGRRPLQIAASVTVASIVVVLLAVGIVSYWEQLKRYRLAVGFTALAAGFAAIRFISLHEVDAWNVQLPWLGVTIELVAAAGASAVALVRLRQVHEQARLR